MLFQGCSSVQQRAMTTLKPAGVQVRACSKMPPSRGSNAAAAARQSVAARLTPVRAMLPAPRVMTVMTAGLRSYVQRSAMQLG